MIRITVCLSVIIIFAPASNDAARLRRQIDWTDLRGNVNFFMDKFLDSARVLMLKSGMDRVPLPDNVQGFHREFLGMPFYGELKAYDGYITGMESLRRTGDAQIDFKGTHFFLRADVGLKNVSVKYSVVAQFMGYGPEAALTGGFENLQCYMELLVPVAKLTDVSLNEFKFHNLGRLKLNIDGLGSTMDAVLGTALEALANLTKSYIASQGAETVKEKLNETLTEMHISPFGTLLDML